MMLPNELQDHFRETYLDMRLGIGLIGAALPILLAVGGLALDHQPLRGSISAYYYSPSLRDLFVGLLVALGVGLYLYKGFSPREDQALNLGGILALGVALVPTAGPGQAAGPATAVHFTCAVLFFVCIAYVAFFRAADTLRLINDPGVEAWYRRAYRWLGIGMLVSPVLAVGLAVAFSGLSGGHPSITFFVEAVPVWLFAGYWLVKRKEMTRSRADERALGGRLIVSRAATDHPPVIVQVEPDLIQRDDWGALADPSVAKKAMA